MTRLPRDPAWWQDEDYCQASYVPEPERDTRPTTPVTTGPLVETLETVIARVRRGAA